MATDPSQQTLHEGFPASVIAGDYKQEIGEAAFNGTVTKAVVLANAAITGAASPASRDWIIYNVTQARQVAHAHLLSGQNPAEGAEYALTIDNGIVLAGDVLEFQSTHVGGTGLVDPGGDVVVTITRGNVSA